MKSEYDKFNKDFHFFRFRLQIPFWANLVQKIKFVNLGWSLVPILIGICRIQWWCSFFLFLTRSILFWEICSKKSKLLLKLKFGTYNTSHKFWDQSPSPYYQCCLQVSETVSWHKLRCCYSANILQHWVGGRGLIYFCKVDHSRISRNFSRNWVGLNNLCETLSQNLRKLGKWNW